METASGQNVSNNFRGVGKMFQTISLNFQRIVPVFYGFCIVSNSGHSC
jgi:hypothetical protein